MITHGNEIKIFAGNSHPELAADIAHHLGFELSEIEVGHFSDGETARTQIDLSGIDAVYFEPFNNTERVALYEREGYKGEAGFALPRLVMNYYFLIALAGTILLAVVWFVLRLLKKQKASRVFGVLLLIAASGVLAFLFAGFPATTIEPLRDLIFVCIIAALIFGAGLSARALLKKE